MPEWDAAHALLPNPEGRSAPDAATPVGPLGAGQIPLGERGEQARPACGSRAAIRFRLYFLARLRRAAGRSGERGDEQLPRLGPGSLSRRRGRIGCPAPVLPGRHTDQIDRTTLPNRSPDSSPDPRAPGTGDDEKSDQRRRSPRSGPVRLVADCKRTTNGDDAAPDVPSPSTGTSTRTATRPRSSSTRTAARSRSTAPASPRAGTSARRGHVRA